ncbi:Terminase small subunit [uncultured Clostridium sp.]|nr:Terminase small subunit [uncultured Clostridium sp.]
MAKLTAKQQRFCDEYLIDLNATQAAIRAGYKASKKSTFEVLGYQLLQKPSVREEIERKMAERSKRTGISQDRVIQELARIAFLNPQKLIDPDDASVRPDATEDDLACIQSVKVKTMNGDKGYSEEREIRLNDKMKALELLGKHLGMFKDKVEMDADLELNISIDYGDEE